MKSNNVIAIGIDQIAKKLKAMYSIDKTIFYKEFSLSQDCFIDERINYEKAFAPIENLLEEGLLPAKIVYIMSNDQVAMDHFELPSKLKKSAESVALELSSRLETPDKFLKVAIPVTGNGTKVRYFIFLVRKELITAIHSGLKQFKFTSRSVTFESASIAYAYLALRSSRKKEHVLFADVKSNSTSIAVINDNVIVGFANIPYGQDVLNIKSSMIAAPRILNAHTLDEKNDLISKIDDTDDDTKNNAIYLTRTLYEICDILENKYKMIDPIIKINVPNRYFDLFNGYMAKSSRPIELVDIKNPILSEHLELYGGFYSNLFYKGLLF